MKERVWYDISDPDGKEWETTKKQDAQKSLLQGGEVIENKIVISHVGATFLRIQTSTPIFLDHFKEGNR